MRIAPLLVATVVCTVGFAGLVQAGDVDRPVSMAAVTSEAETVPGQTVRLIVEATNRADHEVTVDFALAPDPSGWGELEMAGQNTRTLRPGETMEVYVEATPPEDAGIGQRVQFTVEATPDEGESSQASVIAETVPTPAARSDVEQAAGGFFEDELGVETITGLAGLLLVVLILLVVLLAAVSKRQRPVGFEEIDE